MTFGLSVLGFIVLTWRLVTWWNYYAYGPGYRPNPVDRAKKYSRPVKLKVSYRRRKRGVYR